MQPLVYVSITGLRLSRFWHAPRFWKMAFTAMVQARSAEGCLSADARTIQGIQHTFSVWSSKKAMQAYLLQGAHMKAVKAFRSIATGKTFGFETRDVPGQDQVHTLWLENGQTV